mgnify:FL=1
MLFQKASHKEKAEHIIENMINASMKKHAGKDTVILVVIEKMIPGKTSLVDPDILATGKICHICFQKDQYIDQDQNEGGREQISSEIVSIIFWCVLWHSVICTISHRFRSFLFFLIVSIKIGKVKWIDFFD